MKNNFLFTVLALVAFAKPIFALTSTCQVSCSANVYEILDQKYNIAGDQAIDFRAYCKDIGGQILNGYNDSGCGGSANVLCVKFVTLNQTGYGSGDNLFEARQQARKSCSEAMPLISGCSSYTNGGNRLIINYGGFECN